MSTLKKRILIEGEKNEGYDINIWESIGCEGVEISTSIENEEEFEEISFYSISDIEKIIKGLNQAIDYIKTR